VAIAGYDTANGLGNSPWLYYKLVSVQASPIAHEVAALLEEVAAPARPLDGRRDRVRQLRAIARNERGQ
jgi:hypothetical protein